MTNPDDLIINNTGLIYMVMKEMHLTTYGEEIFEEVYSDGMIGLIRGARRYKPNMGYRPDTYLVHCIRSWIYRGIRRRNYLCNKVNYLPSNLSMDLDYGDDPFDVMQLSNCIPDPNVNVEQEAINNVQIETLKYGIEHCLDDREKFIIYHSFNIFGHRYMTYVEMGEVLHISRERINQIRRRALKRLNIYMHKHNCYDWIKKENDINEK